LTEKQKTTQITNLNQQISKLKEQINEANAQIKKYIEKRNALHEKVKKSREEINQLRAERDGFNEKVKLLKQQRDAIRIQVTPIMDKIKALDEKIVELKKKKLPANQRELKEELDAIEWKISTTSLDLQQEKMLVGQVKELELQLSGYKKIDAKYKKINALLAERKVFDDQADVYHQELTDLAKKSQDLHVIIIQKVEAMKKDKAEADSMHQAFIKAKEQNNLVYAQIRQLLDQSTGMKVAARTQDQARWKEEDAKRKEEQAKRKVEQEERAVKEKEIKEKIGSEAREKLQRGEKVNWDEFQLMLSDDEDEDSETQD
jgi:uncharacterized coiled-coil DUF342 family protein